VSPNSVMYITDKMRSIGLRSEPAGGGGRSRQQDHIPAVEDEPHRAQEPAIREFHPLDLAETIREGVLDADLMVRFADRSFGDTLAVTPEDTAGRKFYELGNGQRDTPELCSLIETVRPERATIEAFEVDRVFPSMGRRVAPGLAINEDLL
jgi:hypothetical protein